MAYTLSVVAANGENGGKIKFKNNGMQYRHTFRKSMKSEQFKDGFKNKNINWDRTHLNRDFINPAYSENRTLNIEGAIKNKFEKEYNGKRKVRSDAVLVREMILQLKHDDLDFADMNEAEQEKFKSESEKAYGKMLNYLSKEFKGNNVIGGSLHYDETNPHMHVYVVPMTPDGRLSQKDYFKPKDYRRRVKELREVANECTSDDFVVNQENKSPKGVKAVRNAEFVKNADKIEAERRILKEEQDAIEAEVRDELYEQFRSNPKIKKEAKKSVEDSYLRENYQKIDEQHGLDFRTALRLHNELMEENEKMESVVKRNRIKERDLNKKEEKINRIEANIKAYQKELRMREKSLKEREIKINEKHKDIKGEIAYVTFNQVSAMNAIKNGKPQVAYDLLSKSMIDHDNNPRYTNMPTTSEMIAFAEKAGFNYQQDPHSPVGISTDAEEIIMQFDSYEYELDGP